MSEDRDTLWHLVQRYAVAVDARDAEALAELFADDAVLITPMGELRGREAIATIPARLRRYARTHHELHDQEVIAIGSVDARATATCTATHVTATDGVDEVYVMHLRYHDRFVRVGGGWRFARRRLEVVREEHRRAQRSSDPGSATEPGAP